jgi:hypothetical protein
MIVQDRVGNEWKISADQESLHFHVQHNPAPEPMVTVPTKNMAEYYRLEASEKERFRRDLGRRIGLPLWPLFIKTFFEAEIEHLRALGVFGRLDEKDSEKDLFDLLVPMTMEEALELRSDLAPGGGELEAHAREKQCYREWLRENAVCAVCVQVEGPEDEATLKRLENAGSSIKCCVICQTPATHVGIQREEGEAELILHGLCRSCLPRGPEEKEEMGHKIRSALKEQDRLGGIRTLSDDDEPS